jgi:hypothetical protein
VFDTGVNPGLSDWPKNIGWSSSKQGADDIIYTNKRGGNNRLKRTLSCGDL